MKVFRITVLAASVALSLAACGDKSASESPVTVIETVTAGVSAPTATATASATVTTTTAKAHGLGKVREFYSPSRSLYCQGTEGAAGCSVLKPEGMPANTENALSCDSEHYTDPSTIGFLGKKGVCWWTAQWGMIAQDTPTLDYGETATLASPVGDLTCSMETRGVTCTTGASGFFASKQEFRYQNNGKWYPKAP